MGVSRVIIPSTATNDFDFLAFSFNGTHSWDDFKIIRVSNGDRYGAELGPQMQDKTAENPGGDGMYYFRTNHNQKVFNIDFAFEEIDDVILRNMKQWLNGKELGDLWFEEEPYKIYSAKVTGQPTIKHIPFEQESSDGTTKRIYRGEGTIQFTAYWPYAHTPDYVGSGTASGKDFDSYEGFKNKCEWKVASGLCAVNSGQCRGENLGDLIAPFQLTMPDNVPLDKGTYITIGSLTIQLGEDVEKLHWDSKTGIVSGLMSGGKRLPVSSTGTTLGGIPISTITETSNEDGSITRAASRCSVKIYQNKDADSDDDYQIIDGVWKRYNAAATGEKWVTTGDVPSLQYHYWYY